MPRLLLIALIALAALYAVPKVLASFKALDERKRRRLAGGTLAVLGGTLVVVVLARFGLQWLGLVGAALWAIVRTLGPWVLRLLPLGNHFREHWSRMRNASEEHAEGGGRASASARAAGSMSRSEALEVLGLADGASKEEILHAYRNLMRKVHPDSPGGSTYLASKLNQAKDVLLG